MHKNMNEVRYASMVNKERNRNVRDSFPQQPPALEETIYHMNTMTDFSKFPERTNCSNTMMDQLKTPVASFKAPNPVDGHYRVSSQLNFRDSRKG